VLFAGVAPLTNGAQSCITEDQKYQGKLYKEKKAKPQHQKRDSAQQTSQALVPRSAYVEDAPDADTGAVAIVDAPPRAPSPPPAAYSLGYNEQAQLEDVNVFDFLDESGTPITSRMNHQDVDESRMIEDSIPPAYEEMQRSAVPDVMNFQIPDDEPYSQNGFTYGNEPIRPTSERHESSYNLREQDPNFNFTTPAPKSKHSRTKSKDKDLDASTTKTERKRKRSSPTELDMSLVRAQHERDIMMADAPPMLHSGLTGGLNRLLARPGEFLPSPDYSGDYIENSPLSPMKRAKQGSTKAFARAQREYEIQQEKDRKVRLEQDMAREKEKKEKDRGRERERKERKASTALVKVRPKKRRDDSARGDRRHRGVEVRRVRRDYSSSPSPPRERKAVKAIEYHPAGSRSSAEENGNGAMIVRERGQLAPVRTGEEARADLFMSFINKGPNSERGMSVNKALKRYHRERCDRDLSKADEEKELWKSLRLKKNERGEIVLFFSPADA
jgi:cell growth-regulating nucleolar protein